MRAATITLAATLAADQGSKWLVVHWLDLQSRFFIDVWPPWLTFVMAWNTGVNFGLFADDGAITRWILIAVALAISVWIWLWAWRERGNGAMQVSAGLIVGGALGNVIDRLVYGAVADFINVTCCGIDNPYSFNIADASIFVGAAGLILFAGRQKTP